MRVVHVQKSIINSSPNMSKERTQSFDDDEMSDFDDDDFENEVTTDWCEEPDEPYEEVEKAPVIEKVKITDPFLLEHIDTVRLNAEKHRCLFDVIACEICSIWRCVTTKISTSNKSSITDK